MKKPKLHPPKPPALTHKPKPPAAASKPAAALAVAQEPTQEPAWEIVWESAQPEVQHEPAKKLGSITVTFTGDPRGREDPANPTYQGKSFPKGVPVVVEDGAWIAAYGDKLRRHSHFKVE